MKVTHSYDDPFALFDAWLLEAEQTGMADPNAMALSTVGEDGMPSSRMVLLKERDHRRFTFYTNYESRKGVELLTHPQASLLFYWRELGRQIRIEGNVQQVEDERADAYFASRPRESRLGAIASDQSRPLPGREIFLTRMKELSQKYPGNDIPRPPHWSGFDLYPTRFEFWEARDFRLHDRKVFERTGDAWKTSFLFP